MGESPSTASARMLRGKCPDFGNPVGRVGRIGKQFPKRCVTGVCKLRRWPRPFVLLQICLCRVRSTRDRSGPPLYTPLAFPCPCMPPSRIWFKFRCELHAGVIVVISVSPTSIFGREPSEVFAALSCYSHVHCLGLSSDLFPFT